MAKRNENRPARPKMTEDELGSLVSYEFDNSMGREGNDVSQERALAWDYYMVKPLGNEIDGQSKAQTSDVADVVDGILPSMLRIFASTDEICSFRAEGSEDIEAAEQESAAVNHVFLVQNPAFTIMHTWFMDALIQKNGIVKCFWDESERITEEAYEGLTIDEVAELLEDPELEPYERAERLEELEVKVMTPMGELPQKQQIPVHDIAFRRTSKRGRICIENVPPEEFRISADARDVDPCKARFVGHDTDKTRSALLEMGIDKKIVDQLPMSGRGVNDGEEQQAKYDKAEEQQGRNEARDRSMELVEVREAYIRVDFDGDGKAELRRVLMSGKFVLENEPCDRQPFHVITPKPLPHKHFGQSVADLVMDIQEINTVLLRQTLNNLYHSNQPSLAVWDMAIGDHTIEDLLTTQIGGIKRMARAPQESVMPLAVPFTAAQSFPMMEYFDKLKRDRTGITQDSEGLSPEALKNIQTGVLSQALDVAKGKVEAIARIFAETGFRTLLLHIHELLQKHCDKQFYIELRGDYVPVRPTEWRDRHDMRVTVGLGMGSRDTNLVHLSSIAQHQKMVVDGGGLGTIVSPRNIYRTGAEMVKNANLKHPELYYTDPGDMQVPPPGAEQAQMQQQLLGIEKQKNDLKFQKQAVDAQAKAIELERKVNEQETRHAEEMARLENEKQAQMDRFEIEMEKIRVQLTQIEATTGVNVPGSKI